MGSGVSSDSKCHCGNAASAACIECRHGMCGLCTRKQENGDVCLTCRSRALKLDDERRARLATSSSGRIALIQAATSDVPRRWLVAPAFVIAMIGIMTSVVGTVLSQTGASRGERRAREALGRVLEAENAYRRQAPGFGTLEKLVGANLMPIPQVPGYEVRVEVAKDGHTFWARAIPEHEGLRGMILDAKGEIVLDGGE